MKIDILKSVENFVAPEKPKFSKGENKFKALLERKTIERNSNKVSLDGELSKGEKVKREVVEEKKAKIATEKSSLKETKEENLEVESLDNSNIDELLALLKASEIVIKSDFKELFNSLDEKLMEFDSFAVGIKEALKELKEVLPKNLEEIFLEVAKAVEVGELKEGTIEITKSDNFLGNAENKMEIGSKIEEIVEGLETLEGVIEKVISSNKELSKVLENPTDLENLLNKVKVAKSSLNELKEINNKGIAELEKIKVIDIEDSSENLITEEVKIKEKLEGENNFTEGKDSEEKKDNNDRDDLILKKIMGKEDNQPKIIMTNKFSEFQLGKVENVKGNIEIKNFAVDTVKNVKFMVNNSIKELVVKVNPGNLGEVTIKLSMVAGEMKANLSTASKELYNLVNINEVKVQLGNENIKVSEVNISLYQEDTTFYNSENSFEKNNSDGRGKGYKNNDGFSAIEDNEVEKIEDISSLDIIV